MKNVEEFYKNKLNKMIYYINKDKSEYMFMLCQCK